MDDYLQYVEYDEYERALREEPMISYDSFIDRFILDTPDGETYYFRDYEGAEDFWALNYKQSENLEDE